MTVGQNELKNYLKKESFFIYDSGLIGLAFVNSGRRIRPAFRRTLWVDPAELACTQDQRNHLLRCAGWFQSAQWPVALRTDNPGSGLQTRETLLIK